VPLVWIKTRSEGGALELHFSNHPGTSDSAPLLEKEGSLHEFLQTLKIWIKKERRSLPRVVVGVGGQRNAGFLEC
jgi:hypothetical protein